jgi:hypothetical protein
VQDLEEISKTINDQIEKSLQLSSSGSLRENNYQASQEEEFEEEQTYYELTVKDSISQ